MCTAICYQQAYLLIIKKDKPLPLIEQPTTFKRSNTVCKSYHKYQAQVTLTFAATLKKGNKKNLFTYTFGGGESAEGLMLFTLNERVEK